MFCKYEVIGSSPIVSICIQIGTLDRNPKEKGLPLGSVPKGDLISQSGEVALLFHTGFPFHGKLLKKDPKPGDLT